MGKKSDTLTAEIKCCVVMLPANSMDMHSMFKVKNARHFGKQSFIGGYKKIYLIILW